MLAILGILPPPGQLWSFSPGAIRTLAEISISLAWLRDNVTPSVWLVNIFAFAPTAKTLSCPAGPLHRPKRHDLPDSESISRTPPPSTPLRRKIGCVWLPRLSGWQRQSLHRLLDFLDPLLRLDALGVEVDQTADASALAN
jgi:hypothetical protein